VFSDILIFAVTTTAEFGALLSCCKALAVEFHALGIAAVTNSFFLLFFGPVTGIHSFIFKFKLYLF